MRRYVRRLRNHAAALLCLLAVFPPALAECRVAEGTGPRTLVLALDGVPFRVVEQAREAGAFEDWPPTSRLISSFPSVTNVAFTEMLQPTGLGPAPGYEYSHFDRQRNAKVNATLFNYRERSFAWREEFDAIGRTLSSKLAVYTRPRKKARKELKEAENALASSPSDLVLAHVGSTDALQHLRGDDATMELLLEIDKWQIGLRRRHLEQTGRLLRLVLLSDHGNTDGKIEGAHGFKRRLRNAGLNVTNRLENEDDVVATTFGIVGYGALFLDSAHAERAARAVADHQAVAFAVWISNPGELTLVSLTGEARVRDVSWPTRHCAATHSSSTRRSARWAMRDCSITPGSPPTPTGYATPRSPRIPTH